MKTIRTPEINYFENGFVSFSTSRKDGELYYQRVQWDALRTTCNILDSGKVKDEAHLKELQEKEMIEN